MWVVSAAPGTRDAQALARLSSMVANQEHPDHHIAAADRSA
jgi:hypothetical protein